VSHHIDGTGINRDANNDVYTGLLSNREALLSYDAKRLSVSSEAHLAKRMERCRLA